LSLDDAFSRYRNLRGRIIRRTPTWTVPPDESDADLVDFRRFLSLFARVAYAVRDDLVDLPTVDKAYGSTVEKMVRNESIRGYAEEHASVWPGFLYLWKHLEPVRRTPKPCDDAIRTAEIANWHAPRS
jgi:hypothetical protein